MLFVEDDDSTREAYTLYLTAEGYEVLAAATGEQAITLAHTWAPNVIVLDLGLPDIDGSEVAWQLKTHPHTTGIPIIVLTGSILPHERASALRAGWARQLTKPCKPSDVTDAIRRCVRQGI